MINIIEIETVYREQTKRSERVNREAWRESRPEPATPADVLPLRRTTRQQNQSALPCCA